MTVVCGTTHIYMGDSLACQCGKMRRVSPMPTDVAPMTLVSLQRCACADGHCVARLGVMPVGKFCAMTVQTINVNGHDMPMIAVEGSTYEYKPAQLAPLGSYHPASAPGYGGFLSRPYRAPTSSLSSLSYDELVAGNKRVLDAFMPMDEKIPRATRLIEFSKRDMVLLKFMANHVTDPEQLSVSMLMGIRVNENEKLPSDVAICLGAHREFLAAIDLREREQPS